MEENLWQVVSKTNEDFQLIMKIVLGFDIFGLDQNAKEDQEGIEQSTTFC